MWKKKYLVVLKLIVRNIDGCNKVQINLLLTAIMSKRLNMGIRISGGSEAVCDKLQAASCKLETRSLKLEA
ncbi:hypothetical protein BCS96_16285 [Vibrio breoganii]|nr:hypothetical protein BCU49_06665 [Vibrio breoganii]PML36132.1 hypothetical protein BCT78_10720 [Vibrio breoganii]PML85990.1 hypothetical protein BCT68_06015 [Vibrio breoganii]PMO86905.1 hypothetical protein BCS98_18375 [Vibrio breoganii]PMO95333.1 hypothetical protein BCS96_16285 [Vibrio breoganii]